MSKKNKIWFRAKRFGWGWTPISWQGWILTLLYVFFLVAGARSVNARVHSGSDFLISFATFFIPLTILLLIICYLKGERPKWRWGLK